MQDHWRELHEEFVTIITALTSIQWVNQWKGIKMNNLKFAIS